MKEEELLEFMEEHLTKEMGVEPLFYTSIASYRKLGLDSLDFVGLMMAIENQFKIDLGINLLGLGIDNRIDDTVEKIIEFVNGRK